MYNKKYMNQVWNQKQENAKIARAHTEDMWKKYNANIELSIQNSKIYLEDFTKDYSQDTPPGNIPAIRLIKTDTIDCIKVARSHITTKVIESKNPKICILNFASFKNPGGRFIDGSMAQEEAICHKTDLYNILSDKRITDKFYTPNLKSLNKALYKNRAIYTPNVIVELDTSVKDVKQTVTVDVLTCAAPNYNAANKYQNIQRDECNEVMDSRIKYILDIMDENKVDIAILGAFGCGVFGNDPKFVAESFQKHIKSFDYNMVWCLFAIPGGPNFNAFKEILTNGQTSTIYI